MLRFILLHGSGYVIEGVNSICENVRLNWCVCIERSAENVCLVQVNGFSGIRALD